MEQDLLLIVGMTPLKKKKGADLNMRAPNDWEELLRRDGCPRCGGLMVAEPCVDYLDSTGHYDFLARRCVLCGEVVDPVILRNRYRVATTQNTR